MTLCVEELEMKLGTKAWRRVENCDLQVPGRWWAAPQGSLLANCPALHAVLTLVKSSEIPKKPSPEAKIKVNRYGRGSGGRGWVRLGMWHWSPHLRQFKSYHWYNWKLGTSAPWRIARWLLRSVCSGHPWGARKFVLPLPITGDSGNQQMISESV